MSQLEAEYDNLTAALYRAVPGSETYVTLLGRICDLAERGYLHACGVLAEQYALQRTVYDPIAAYKWFYVALAREGFSTKYENVSGSDEHYLGLPGDYRNEALVSDMIRELGVRKLQSLDLDAQSWLAAHPDLTHE